MNPSNSKKGLKDESSVIAKDSRYQKWWVTVLQSLAPTCLNTPAWKFLVCWIRPSLAGPGVFNWVWSSTGQEQDRAIKEEHSHPAW